MRRIDRGLREIRERFLDRLSERLDRIRRAADRAPDEPSATVALGQEIHSLIGAAGTLGFHDLAAAAEAVDRALREGADPAAVAEGLVLLHACGDAYARERTAA